MGAIIASRSIQHEEIRKERAEARKLVPAAMWKVPLEELDLPGRIHNLLLDNEIETVGDVLFNLALGDDVILNFRGLGDAALETIKERIAAFELSYAEALVIEEAEGEASLEVDAIAEIEEITEIKTEVVDEEVTIAALDEIEVETKTETTDDVLDLVDDLSQSLVQVEEKPVKEKKRGVVIARQTAAEKRAEEEQKLAEEEAEKTRKSRSRELVFDEEIGEVVAKRKRKGSRRTQEWDDFDLDDF
jgi:hypothetical protein